MGINSKFNRVKAGVNMYVMNDDFFDQFSVLFTARTSVIDGKEYALGTFAAQMLETDWTIVKRLEEEIHSFQEDFTVFLSARSTSSAAIAQQGLNRVWALMERLPLYRELNHDLNEKRLMRYMLEHPREVDDMLTERTGRNQMLHRWLEKLADLPDSLFHFCQDTMWMLEAYFKDLPSRRPEAYAQAYQKYQFDITEGVRIQEEEQEDTGDISEIEIPEMTFPVRLSFKPTIMTVRDQPKVVLADELIFEDLASFLYTDLYRGMAAGNLPRRCQNCRRFFLSVGAYDTIYCDRIAPGETSKTCRKVGAHRRETKKNGTDFIQREYYRVYNRLKARKRNGRISEDEWNQAVAHAQELKERAKRGGIEDAELKRLFDAM